MRERDGSGERPWGGKHKGRHHHPPGAQTFRRGRALEFMDRLQIKRATLKQQLEAPEFQEIRPILLGELKAIELVMEEFARHFELHETSEAPSGLPADEGKA